MVCGLSAIGLSGIAIPFEVAPLMQSPIEVLIPASAGTRPRREGLAVYRVSNPPPIWRPRGSRLPLAHPAYCWAQVASALARNIPWRPGRQTEPLTSEHLPGHLMVPGRQELVWVVQLGDALMTRQRPLLTHQQFSSAIALWRGQRGFGVPTELFPLLRPDTDSPRESLLRLIVIDAGFPVPTVNLRVQVNNTNVYLDLTWEEHKINLEYQGRQHFDDSNQVKRDLHRRRLLEAQGWTVVDAANQDLTNPTALLARLAHAFRNTTTRR
jgi:very-short-patch-repair endonuclease